MVTESCHDFTLCHDVFLFTRIAAFDLRLHAQFFDEKERGLKIIFTSLAIARLAPLRGVHTGLSCYLGVGGVRGSVQCTVYRVWGEDSVSDLDRVA